MVKELRDKTGAGMMDCKTALAETGRRHRGAVDWLRKKGLAKAAKKAGRVAAEGLIAAASSGPSAHGRSQLGDRLRRPQRQFQAFVAGIAKLALTGDGDVALAGSRPLPGGKHDDRGPLQELIATIGENMTLRRSRSSRSSRASSPPMSTARCAEGLGKIGVIVGAESTGDATLSDARPADGHARRRHEPAGARCHRDPAETIEREKAILREKNAGKPANVLDKIVESGLKTYYKEVTLLEQASVIPEHANKTIAQVLKEAEPRCGAPVKVDGLRALCLGEGRQTRGTTGPDFAYGESRAMSR